MLDTVVGWIEKALTWAVNCLPDSPFTMLDNSPIQSILPYINWFIPLSSMVSILEVWLSAIAVYYVYSAVLRWVKAIN